VNAASDQPAAPASRSAQDRARPTSRSGLAAPRQGRGLPRDAVSKLLDRQHGILSREQATTLGVGRNAINYRIRPGGSWERLFPGVYLAGRGIPTVDQLDMAALLYAGDRSMLTGLAALRRYGILPSYAGPVEVLVPTSSSRADLDYVQIRRTSRLPAGAATQGPIRFTTVPRAVTDAAIRANSLGDMRAIVAVGVDRGRCSLDSLAAELGQSRLRNSAQLRAVLGDVASGIRSGPEGDLMDLIDRSDLPAPLYNPRLYLGDAFLATPDAWWEPFGVAVEVDSREYHYEVADWEHTMQRDARMTAVGIRVLHFTPRRIRAEPDPVLAAIRRTLQIGARVPGIRTVPSD
jgi:hypothetical protein